MRKMYTNIGIISIIEDRMYGAGGTEAITIGTGIHITSEERTSINITITFIDFT